MYMLAIVNDDTCRLCHNEKEAAELCECDALAHMRPPGALDHHYLHTEK